jgi:penicillin-binding protein 1A
MRKNCFRLGLLTMLAAIAGAGSGYFMRLDLPDVRSLESYRPPSMSRMLDREGREVAVFSSEKRIVLTPAEIPQHFREALIASEDARFLKHTGIDLRGVARAVVTDLRERSRSQGASTITMQLAGGLFLDRSHKTVRRKLGEALLALEVERNYSKEEILTLYTNQVHMGHGLFGLGAAARYYFNKRAQELTLNEAATLVGVLPRPASYSPYHDMERATERRNLVLRRMVQMGYLDAASAASVAREKIVLAQPSPSGEKAPFFTEEVRRGLREQYGSERLYGDGFVVRTTLDARLQAIANEAVREGLTALVERRGEDPSKPQPEAALVALDPATGEVLAMVGGFDFDRSQFNRVTQARRQSGSAFKPLVMAAALGAGATPADVVMDEPTVFLDRQRKLPYQPENFTNEYYGAMTLRQAMEKSSNIVAVKLLERIGYDAAIATARKLGIESRLRPYPSLALGAFEVSLLELTSAYAAFANKGVWVEPHWIESVVDRQGKLVERAQPRVVDALTPQVAYLMNHTLTGVVEHGTGKKAAELGRVLAGKTGTTDGYTDAWFVGYSPSLVVGVWVGLDERKSLGEGETGARAALPIWTEFMRRALEERPPEFFPVPAGISFSHVDARTGLLAGRGCGGRLREAFVATTEPAEQCTAGHHDRLRLPYPFHRYPVDRDGTLVIPEGELRELLEREREIYHHARYGLIESRGPEGTVTLRVRLVPDPPPTEEPELPERFWPGEWVGQDGRRAVHLWTR